MVAWIVALYGLEYALGIITFYQFILEEAIQGGCMACYIGKKYDKIGTMDPVIDRLENHTIPRLEDYNNTWGYIAIYNRGAFQAFIKASKLAARAYKECRGEEVETPTEEPIREFPIIFTDRIKKEPAEVYTKDLVLFTTSFACSEPYPEPTEEMDIVWAIDDIEEKREKLTAPANMKERMIHLEKRFTNPGHHKIRVLICKPASLTEKPEKPTPWFPPPLSPDSPVELTTRIKREPTPAYGNTPITFSIKFRAVNISSEPTEEVDLAWTIDGTEIKRERKAAPANLLESEIQMIQTFNTPGIYKIKCMVCAEGFGGCLPWDEAGYTIEIKPPRAATEFTTRITRDPSPAHINDLVLFIVKFACSIDYPTPTEKMNFIWTIDDIEVKTLELVAQANKEETQISIEKTWNEPGKHKIKCKCNSFYNEEEHTIDERTYTVSIKPIMTATEFTGGITREPTPAHTHDLVHFIVKFACSIDYPTETEEMDIVWTIDDIEVKRETKAALSHMKETETSIEKKWTEPGKHKVKCLLEGFYFEEIRTIDEATYTIGITEP